MKTIIFLFVLKTLAFSQVKDIFEYGSKINDYIAMNFIESSDRNFNIQMLDSIFSFALAISDSNIADALIFCSIGTMIFQKFNVQIPLLKIIIPFSVFTKVDDQKFQMKTKKLPSRLFDDSPQNEFGDKDKIVHFFSVAYLSYIFGENFSNHIGKFVEEFEENFKVDGKIDWRDLKINQLGSEFGKNLRCKIIFPSSILAKETRLSYGKNFDN